ncbi:hypothetical protein ACFRMQ_11770 [Kitasatospora sp. NPDC056783]|uniref:glycine-rich protein n=1 Tax=Kitasatospora sp. NPDC056783 TaxID=3345943 RepID=UPI0036B583AB
MPQTTVTQHFAYTGADQYFTVPSGVTTIDIKAWGAGGGGTWGTTSQVNAGCGGGGGGFSRGTVAVVPGQRLLVVVGQGGRANSSAGTYGQGGAGNNAAYPGGSGGGLSGVFTSSFAQPHALVVAGGGGGATGTRNADVGPGGGGGASGSTRGHKNSRNGAPGTQTAGGHAGTGGAAAGAPGTALSGGRSAQITGTFTMGGGGGGGGYFGGGGGSSQANSNDAHQVPGVGGGGSGYLAPTVTAGSTEAGQAAPSRYTGGTAAGGSDPDYRSGVGVGGGQRTNGGNGQVVVHWVEFTVTPGGPPDIELVQGEAVGYPGVRVEASVAIAPVSVTVTLPAGQGLHFGSQTVPDHQLTVQNHPQPPTAYMGTLSADGLSLTFSNVDLELPDTSTLWVAVSAGSSAPLGTSSVSFTVAGQTSPSNPVIVNPAFTVSPSGALQDAPRSGAPTYPGVEVRNDGSQSLPAQIVTVTLPLDAGTRFGTPGAPDHQLTVRDSGGTTTVYTGIVSADGQSLTFTNVDLDIPANGATSMMYVCVSAGAGTPVGPTSVQFSIGSQTSQSTTLNVI